MRRKLVNFLFPSVCLICREEIAEGGGFFCASCFSSLRFITEPFCKCCGEPFPYDSLKGKEGICLSCREKPPLWDEARALFIYNNSARKLLFPLKYADRQENIKPLATLMHRFGSKFLSSKSEEKESVLVPVPLHFSKLWSRRYNQAALLAQRLGVLQGVQVVSDALLRPRRTRPLAHLSVEQRREELKDAFQVNKNRLIYLKDRRIILIDDILTTGATAEACASVLKKAGCSRVDLFVVAKACEGAI